MADNLIDCDGREPPGLDIFITPGKHAGAGRKILEYTYRPPSQPLPKDRALEQELRNEGVDIENQSGYKTRFSRRRKQIPLILPPAKLVCEGLKAARERDAQPSQNRNAYPLPLEYYLFFDRDPSYSGSGNVTHEDMYLLRLAEYCFNQCR